MFATVTTASYNFCCKREVNLKKQLCITFQNDSLFSLQGKYVFIGFSSPHLPFYTGSRVCYNNIGL